MQSSNKKPRVAVVSPFLDKTHGTERIVIEWLSRLADDFELHVYSQRVEGFDESKFTYHRIPKLGGPHILNFIWWFVVNHMIRAWDWAFRGLKYDILFSPGINCFDADVISVHIVFAEYLRSAERELRFSANPIGAWPRLLHRRIYYRLIICLERIIYPSRRTELVLIAKKTASDLERFYCSKRDWSILYLGLDHHRFNPARCAEVRGVARESLGLATNDFCLLLVGNDLLKKGILSLLDALSSLGDVPFKLLIVSREAGGAYETAIAEKGLEGRVIFRPQRPDVEFYFAAADLYTGPSLEDTFAMPPEEAMACGLPVIASLANGISEVIKHGENGLILSDARDSETLAKMIRGVYEDQNFRFALGENARQSVQQFTWERNASDLHTIFEGVLRRKDQPPFVGKAVEPRS